MKVSHAIAFFAAVLLSFSMYAQGGTPRILAGRVVDVWDEPLAGANVFVRGDTGNGTSTDANGYFSIELPDWSEILVEISFLGMKTSTVSYTGQKESCWCYCSFQCLRRTRQPIRCSRQTGAGRTTAGC